ncbi:hypothetical protein DL762_007903 [Monosporascus cannonballus]|uniref:Arb2 domain-containing protein n=1 Tax=Monosporascus cannonballus TaxID=155416 RepID=A0ABY0H203_9PEZI|nr:hypothetical protein DL762_007903 [Monosporascus cannonballus]RYO98497.1 hypothetical protein DL763_002149 [Monosporascus cannonballus]
MFRRKWSGLPADPAFPSDLKKLGYFINEDDEVRSIENPDYYFKYFLSRNGRYNERQRFAMNQALEEEIHKRLTNLGMKKILLPLGTPTTTDDGTTTTTTVPHVPIFVSADIAQKSRVVLIFGESFQDLGVLAHRVVVGPGGVNKGSMVSIVYSLQQQRSSPTGAAAPGIILANTGQLLWCPSAGRALTRHAFDAAPMKSAVHEGRLVDEHRNRVPGNHSVAEHVRYVFESVIPAFVDPRKEARIDVVAVGDAVEAVQRYLDGEAAWARWGNRVSCFANVGGYYPTWELKCEGFKQFLRDKARSYVPSLEPLNTVLSGPDGNPHTATFTALGSPIFSGGTPHFTELLLVEGGSAVLDFLQEVALSFSADYRNPEFHVTYRDLRAADQEDEDWSNWRGPEDADQVTMPTVEVSAAAAAVPDAGVVAAAEKKNGEEKGTVGEPTNARGHEGKGSGGERLVEGVKDEAEVGSENAGDDSGKRRSSDSRGVREGKKEAEVEITSGEPLAGGEGTVEELRAAMEKKLVIDEI